jgi:hypothetical protein
MRLPAGKNKEIAHEKNEKIQFGITDCRVDFNSLVINVFFRFFRVFRGQLSFFGDPL